MVRDLVVTKVRWQDSTAELEKKFAAMLTDLMPKTKIPISLEQLKASRTAAMEQTNLEGLKHDPPKILVVEEPSVLLQYNGEPRGGDSRFNPRTDRRHALCGGAR